MPDDDSLIPATYAEVITALANALRFDERGKPHRHGAELAVQIAAGTLARYPDAAGLLVVRRPPAAAPRTPKSG